MTPLSRTLRWRGRDLETLEHAQLDADAHGTRLAGTIIGPDFGLFYRATLDARGHTRTLDITHADGRALALRADGNGSWSDADHHPLPALAGAIDIDIWPTPLTNTLPIRRTAWTDHAPVEFTMTWIDATTLTVTRSAQTYTRLDPTHFRFQSENFEAVLEVDPDGFVLDYPGLFVAIP